MFSITPSGNNQATLERRMFSKTTSLEKQWKDFQIKKDKQVHNNHTQCVILGCTQVWKNSYKGHLGVIGDNLKISWYHTILGSKKLGNRRVPIQCPCKLSLAERQRLSLLGGTEVYVSECPGLESLMGGCLPTWSTYRWKCAGGGVGFRCFGKLLM